MMRENNGQLITRVVFPLNLPLPAQGLSSREPLAKVRLSL
jgi:hypothetical protein